MKLVTFLYQEATYLGAIRGDQVIDLAKAWAAHQASKGNLVDVSGFPGNMVALLRAEETWQALSIVLDWAESLPETTRASLGWPLHEVGLAPPLINPSKVICVGLNYHDHCRESDLQVPERPILFAKFPSTIIGPEEQIRWPRDMSQQVDYEAELAVVIGRQARDVPVDRAYDHVAGYTNLNDVSARDAQFGDGQWVRGKSFDTFCPIGPYLLTTDEVPDPHTLRVRCWVNGELRQDSNTRELIFRVPELVAYISRTSTLMPGDIIGTGTPGGVGVFRDPPVFLKPGDVVEVEIEKLGRLRNPVG